MKYKIRQKRFTNSQFFKTTQDFSTIRIMKVRKFSRTRRPILNLVWTVCERNCKLKAKCWSLIYSIHVNFLQAEITT